MGRPGSGKSLYMLWILEQFVKAGRKVASNIELTPECPFIDKVALLDDPEEEYPVFREECNGKPYRAFWHYLGPGWAIVIDEADNYFDCTDHGKMAKDVRLYFKQHRKLKHDVVLGVQCVDNLYVRIRRMVQSWIVCEYTRSTAGFVEKHFPLSWSRFIRGEYCDQALRQLVNAGHFWYHEAQRMFSWYRTEQIVGTTAHYAEWMNNHNGKETHDEGPQAHANYQPT